MSSEISAYRCAACGNKTRFDVFESLRRRRFVHFDLGGEAVTEEEEILDHDTEKVVCRWCDRSDAIEVRSVTDSNGG